MSFRPLFILNPELAITTMCSLLRAALHTRHSVKILIPPLTSHARNLSSLSKEHKFPMEYRHLGRSGLKVSAISYGTWVTFGHQIDDLVAFENVQMCLRYGINLFDTAE